MTQITVSVFVGYNGLHCWQCAFARNGGPYCELFRKSLAQRSYPEGGDPPTRCEECIAAVGQPPLFAEGGYLIPLKLKGTPAVDKLIKKAKSENQSVDFI